MLLHRLLTPLAVALLCWTSDADAELFGRLPATPGGTEYRAYYDSDLDITWLADANLATSNTFGVEPINGPETGNPGAMQHLTATQYIAAMNDACYLGFSTWRMPDVTPLNGTEFMEVTTNDGSTDRGFNISAPGTAYAGSTASELPHLYYNTLGNLAAVDTSGVHRACELAAPDYCLSDRGPFTNMVALAYWTGRSWAQNPANAWGFRTDWGSQTVFGKQLGGHVWPVLDGDLAANPVICGDANGDGSTTAADALVALVTSVGLAACPAIRCDLDDSGAVTATDARAILRASVGLSVTFTCPAC
jgi:hypothetical protein